MANTTSLAAAAFDDRVLYFSPTDPNAWGKPEKNVNLNANKLGLGSTDPLYTLDVDGDVHVRSSPSIKSDVIVLGNKLCWIDASNNTQCFDIESGSDTIFDKQLDNTCTGTTIPNGITAGYGGVNCATPVSNTDFMCGTYSTSSSVKQKILTGFSSGRPICVRQDGKCDAETVKLCPGKPLERYYTIPKLDNNSSHPINGILATDGFTKLIFLCNNGVVTLDTGTVNPSSYPNGSGVCGNP
jgi:hypothetical protein